MKVEIAEGPARPGFVMFLVGMSALIIVPMWMKASPSVPAANHSKPEAVAAAAPAQKLVEAPERNVDPMPAPKPPAYVPREVAPPRGAAVSVFAEQPKPAATVPLAQAAKNPLSSEERWGIQVCSARLIMGNHFVDLRYKVTDAAKATQLSGNRRAQAYILDPVTGTKLPLPSRPREASFPPAANRLSPGKTLFAVVANPRGLLKSGSKVSVVIGDALPSEVTID